MADEPPDTQSSPPPDPPAGDEMPTRLANTRLGPDDPTGTAPFLAPLTPASAATALLVAGRRLGDFELIRVLGAGSFARVYLARQLSLGRHVALKVTPSVTAHPPRPDAPTADLGLAAEARTLACLEHDHIVHVFAEVVDSELGLRILCMQYVPGTTLARVLTVLAALTPEQRSGQAILDAIDRLCKEPPDFDPAALRDREFLGRCDYLEACAWLGARLADALAHAHRHGILHCDVKPANILLNRYGRPLLADFNVAFVSRPGRRGSSGIGGTLVYMAPEHLDACNPEDPTGPEAVDGRSDVYSLGVVLFEMLTGRLPFDDRRITTGTAETMRVLAGQRRQQAPLPEPDAGTLGRIVQRCLEPDPARRYPTATDLAEALDGFRALRSATRELPTAGPLTRLQLRAPFVVGALLMVLPHLLASTINVSYNAVRIVGDLTPAQQALFPRLVLGYNLVAYPLAFLILYRLLMPAVRLVRRLAEPGPVDSAEVEAVRRWVLRWPLWAAALSALGWLPGGVLFPLLLDRLTGPVRGVFFGHFAISFTIAGLIALTYSVFAAQYLVLRVLYPRLWVDGRAFCATARAELKGPARHLWIYQLLAVLIPLAAAVLTVDAGPDTLTPSGIRPFRILVTALIALGTVGLAVTMMITSLLNQTLTALRGSKSK